MLKEKLKGFVAGICATVLITGSITALAALTQIEVYSGGIKVFWDGVEKTLYDAKRNKVEPMIYNGTTYVPLRAMSEIMGKEVNWDQANYTVYVGDMPVGDTTPLHTLDRSLIDRADTSIRTGEDATFQLKNKTIQCENLLYAFADTNIYILDGQYKKLVAKAVIPYTSVGSDGENTLTFYSIENDGTKNEIKRYDLRQTESPEDIEINLRGVQNLGINFGGSSEYIALYDIYLIG